MKRRTAAKSGAAPASTGEVPRSVRNTRSGSAGDRATEVSPKIARASRSSSAKPRFGNRPSAHAIGTKDATPPCQTALPSPSQSIVNSVHTATIERAGA